jgi:hypothetical protein
MIRQLATLVIVAFSAPAWSQWLSLPTPDIPRTVDGKADLAAPTPRSHDGHPDLTGLWRLRRVTGDLFDEDKIQEWARKIIDEREQSFFDDEPGKRCLPRGPSYLVVGDQLRRIVQNPSMIVFLNEDFTFRQIHMDGRTLETSPHPAWMGYSIGRWDGDTLVVESNGYNDKTWVHNEGLPHTEMLRITERYSRPDFGHMQIDVMYDDPGTFNAPLHAAFNLEFAADDGLLEQVCSEASEGRSHWIGKGSDAQTTAVEVASGILRMYVGTYRGYWGNTIVTAEVTLEGGELFLRRDLGRNNATEKFRLVAQSDTSFACSCGLGFIFTRDDDGFATEVQEVHVSGAWTFERIR